MNLRPEEVERPTQLHAFQLSDSVRNVPFNNRDNRSQIVVAVPLGCTYEERSEVPLGKV